ncbi:endonuclease [Sciscionella sediminilitoris]|uniref:endonuclease n=1 Tax=Sciscionella sediminilitoris TaxID=1445613 RepID=UPI000AC41213|nr:endonuclease [Sciscionella sp. SE31]
MRRSLDVCGQTYAEQAGIRLADKPSPLYRLSVLALLLSTRIKAEIAVAAARELTQAGMTSPRRMAAATWQQRVDALGRAGYRRYDEQTATALGQGAELLQREYQGDLRELRRRAGASADGIRERLTELPRIGPTGANIFCREVQGIWPELRPCFDQKALQGAKALGLPQSPEALRKLVAAGRLPAAAAALVRAGLRPTTAKQVRAAVAG